MRKRILPDRRSNAEKREDADRRVETVRRRGLSDAAYSLETLWRNAIALLFVLWGVWVLILPFHNAWDFLRAGCFAMGTELIVINFLINSSYRRTSRMSEGAAKNMPRHIRWVAASYLLCVAALLGAVYDRIGDDPKWYGLPSAFVAFAVGVIALGFMFRFAVARQGVGPDSANPGRRAGDTE